MGSDILGYVVCTTCLEPKAVKQGTGKRKAYVHARCSCGPDPRTGAKAQSELKAYKPLEEVEAEIEALKKPKPEPEAKTEPKTEAKPEPKTEAKPEPKKEGGDLKKCVGIGAVLGLIFGCIKVVV